LIHDALMAGAKRSKALPFRFVAAIEQVPHLAATLDAAMLAAMTDSEKLPGMTYLVIDASYSMVGAQISSRSSIDRLHAAGALAVMIREVCDQSRVFVFSDEWKETKNLRGYAMLNDILMYDNGGTYLGRCLEGIKKLPCPDRIVVVTDEQVHDKIPAAFVKHSYLVNVAPYRPALPAKHNGWQRISGFSERLVDWMQFEENGNG
jgi:60 kDa SS-A/Ro ribonucleoprotein